MKYAIVQSGGKQFRAQEGDVLEVERLDAAVGERVELGPVLLLADGEALTIGTPAVAGAKVTATVLGQVKGPKIVVFKFKPKQRYRRRTGHRHQYTQVKVEEILAG